jgi:hypothetical protein
MKNRVFRARILLVFVGILTFAGCDGDDVRMKLLVYDKNEDIYVYDTVTLQTLHNIKRLDGDATVLKGGLSIRIDYQSGGLEWLDEGHDIAFGAVRDGDVLVPDSFDSLAMASIYYSMELSYLFFKNELALKGRMPKRLPTYYEPTIETIDNSGVRRKETDNAFYMKISNEERGFFIVPFKQFQWIPMALNGGILTHEYTHYIFDVFVLDSAESLNQPSSNFMRSVNEATSDFLAVVRTQDPDYMSHSVPAGLFVTPECNASRFMELTRDISDPDSTYRNYSAVMDLLARNANSSNYCPYEIGLFVAAMLYEISEEIDHSEAEDDPSKKTLIRVGKWWLNALEALGGQLRDRSDFELWELFSLFVAEIYQSSEKAAACNIIRTRYAFYIDEVEGC